MGRGDRSVSFRSFEDTYTAGFSGSWVGWTGSLKKENDSLSARFEWSGLCRCCRGRHVHLGRVLQKAGEHRVWLLMVTIRRVELECEGEGGVCTVCYVSFSDELLLFELPNEGEEYSRVNW